MRQTKSNLLLSLVVVLLVVCGWTLNRSSHLSTENGNLKVQMLNLEATATRPAPATQAAPTTQTTPADVDEVRQLRDSEQQLRQEVLRLRGQVGVALRAQADAATQAQSNSAPALGGFASIFTNAMSQGFTMAKGMQQQQALSRFTRMKEKLNLTPEQEQSLRTLMLAQPEMNMELAQKALTGKLTPEETAAMRASSASQEPQILALLTPEQQTAFGELKNEEKSNNARVVASAEMVQMQTLLGLSQEQQDKVFPILFDQSLKRLADPTAGLTSTGANPANALSSAVEMLQRQTEEKITALQGVLTPAQLEGYRQQQTRQMDMMKDVFKMMGPATGQAPGK